MWTPPKLYLFVDFLSFMPTKKVFSKQQNILIAPLLMPHSPSCLSFYKIVALLFWFLTVTNLAFFGWALASFVSRQQNKLPQFCEQRLFVFHFHWSDYSTKNVKCVPKITIFQISIFRKNNRFLTAHKIRSSKISEDEPND